MSNTPPSPHEPSPYAAATSAPADSHSGRKRCSNCDMPNHISNTTCWLCHGDLSHAVVDHNPVPTPPPSPGSLGKYTRFMVLCSIPLLLLIAVLIVLQAMNPSSIPEQPIAAAAFFIILVFPVLTAVISSIQAYRSGTMERHPILDVFLRGVIAVSVVSAVSMALTFAIFIAFFLYCIGVIATGNVNFHGP